MNHKKPIFLSVFIILIMVTTLIAFADEPAVTSATPVSSDTQWAWGEVTNLDNQAKTFTLKYLDYETDQEKELILAIDDKTTFENIKSLDEIKIKDTLSIDYVVGADNKNIAKNISFEKPDVVTTTPAQTTEAVKPLEMPSVTEQPAIKSETPVVSTEAEQPAPEAQSAPIAEQNPVQ